MKASNLVEFYVVADGGDFLGNFETTPRLEDAKRFNEFAAARSACISNRCTKVFSVHLKEAWSDDLEIASRRRVIRAQKGTNK